MSNPTQEFTVAWQRDAPRILIYARRHVGFSDAPDIVAETFTIAWRRWSDVPIPATPWLFGTARHVVHNHLRGQRRRIALKQRIRLLDAVAAASHDAPHERTDALVRLASLPEQHREALLLISWDGLSPEAAAVALGISPAALRKRLQRARAAIDTPTVRNALQRSTLQESP